MRISQHTASFLVLLLAVFVIGATGIASVASQERTPVSRGEDAEALKNELRLQSEEIKVLKTEIESLKKKLAAQGSLLRDIREEKILSLQDEFRKREDVAGLEERERNWVELFIRRANQHLPPGAKEIPSESEVRQLLPLLKRFCEPVSELQTKWIRALNAKDSSAPEVLKQRADLIEALNGEYDRIFGAERAKLYHFSDKMPQPID